MNSVFPAATAVTVKARPPFDEMWAINELHPLKKEEQQRIAMSHQPQSLS